MSVVSLRRALNIQDDSTSDGVDTLNPLEPTLFLLESIWPSIELMLSLASSKTAMTLYLYSNRALVFSTTLDGFTQLDPLQQCLDLDNDRVSSAPVAYERDSATPIDDYIAFGHQVDSSLSNQRIYTADLPLLGRTALIADNATVDAANRHDRAIVDANFVVIERAWIAVRQFIFSTLGTHLIAMQMAHEMATVTLATNLVVGAWKLEVENLQTAGPGGQQELQRLSKIIQAENEVVLSIVRNFLASNSPDNYASVAAVTKEHFDFSAMVARVCDIYSATQRGSLLSFIVDLDRSSIRLHGHAVEMERALHNVLSNAVKYSYVTTSSSGQRVIRVYLSPNYSPKPPRWALVVENYGTGLASDEVQRVFSRGFRGRAARQQVPYGIGMGLFEVQRIMRQYGGFARLSSKHLHSDPSGDVYLTRVYLVFNKSGARLGS